MITSFAMRDRGPLPEPRTWLYPCNARGLIGRKITAPGGLQAMERSISLNEEMEILLDMVRNNILFLFNWNILQPKLAAADGFAPGAVQKCMALLRLHRLAPTRKRAW